MPAKQQLESDNRAARSSRERILTATYDLIHATSGRRDVSVREIATAAEVNLALINYYFGSKAELLSELYRQVSLPIVKERAARLAAIKECAAIEPILDAWLRPLLLNGPGRDPTARQALSFFLQMHHAELRARLFAEMFDPGNLDFIDALSLALPHLPRPTLIWRLYALGGAAVAYIDRMTQASISKLSAQACAATDFEQQRRQLMAFAVAGFTAPDPA